MKISLRRLAGCTAVLTIPMIGFAADQKTVPLNIAPPQAIERAIHVGAADPNQVLHLAVSLPFANTAEVEHFAASVSDPKNLNYRHFLTPEQVGQRFGLPQWRVEKIANFLRANGMNVTLQAKNRLSILADTTVANAAKTFGVSFEAYRSTDPQDAAQPERFSFMGSPKVPAEIAGTVLDIAGMENFTRPKGHTMTPTMTRTLYNTAPLFNAGNTGAGRTIGISSWDGFRLSNASGFISNYALPVPSAGALSNITVTTVDGGSGAGTQSGEGDLDIQCALSVAPLANIIIYDGYNGDLINVLTKEINDNLADIVTESYGWGITASSSLTAVHNLHLSMTSQGMTYLAASGDSGTSISTYGYPDLEPEVLVVGGTSVTTGSTGTRTTEVTWTSGGGGWQTTTAATFNTKPSYQSAVGPSGVNYRLVPDIAANADPNTGYTLYLEAGTYSSFTLSSTGMYSGFGGTSAASPTMAASLAVAEQAIIAGGGLTANSAGKRRFGRINDLLYSYNGNANILYDVTSGSNGSLPNGSTSTAAAGWDTATGLGALNFQGLVNQVLGVKVGISSLSLSSSSIYGGTSTKVTGTVSLTAAAPTGGAVISLSANSTVATLSASSITIAAGSTSGTFTFTASAVNSSTAILFTASGLSTTATASCTVNPAVLSAVSLSTSSVVGGVTNPTFTVTLTGPAGSSGAVVTLGSSNTSAAKFSLGSVTVPSGSTSTTAAVTSYAVNANTSVTLTGTNNVSETATLTVTAAALSALSLSTTSMTGNGSTTVTGTVTLTGPAGPSGVTVTLKSSNTTAVPVSASVKVAAGATSATFTFIPAKVSASTSATLTATLGSTSKTATITDK